MAQVIYKTGPKYNDIRFSIKTNNNECLKIFSIGWRSQLFCFLVVRCRGLRLDDSKSNYLIVMLWFCITNCMRLLDFFDVRYAVFVALKRSILTRQSSVTSRSLLKNSLLLTIFKIIHWITKIITFYKKFHVYLFHINKY